MNRARHAERRVAALLAASLLTASAVAAPDFDGVNDRQPDGSTPLQWAVYEVDVPEVRRLINAGADVSAANDYGATPMGLAAEIGHTEMLGLLLDAGADPDAPNGDGQTALMLAARSGSVDIARALLERGADVNARENWRGQTALIWAADSRFPAIVELLIASVTGSSPGRWPCSDW